MSCQFCHGKGWAWFATSVRILENGVIVVENSEMVACIVCDGTGFEKPDDDE